MKVLIVSAMHGRHNTVKYCQDKMKDLTNVSWLMGYSAKEDGAFLKSIGVKNTYQVPNNPLWAKWQRGVDLAKHLYFDILLFLGSDDYVDQSYIDYIIKELEHFDMIGTKDILFEDKGSVYWWMGYKCIRHGEPAGAGRCFTRKACITLDWDFFTNSKDSGLDGHLWQRVQDFGLITKVVKLQDAGIKLVDVKDKDSLTPISKFKGLVKLM